MQPLGERIKRYLTFASGLLECVGFAGVIYGWASLVFVLEEEGYFFELCQLLNNTSQQQVSVCKYNCYPQFDRFHLIFTIATFTDAFPAFLIGFLFDQLGTMVTRLIGIFMYTTATLMIAFSTAATAALLFPAMCLLSIGGAIFLLTNIQVGNLFEQKRSTVITWYTGAFASAPIAFLLIKVLYEAGLSVKSMFLFISCLSPIHILRTIFLLPRTYIPYRIPEGYTYGFSCAKLGLMLSRERQPQHGGDKMEGERQEEREGDRREGQEETEGDTGEREKETEAIISAESQPKRAEDFEGNEEEIPSFRSSVFSKLFLTNLVWLSILRLRHNLFIGTLNPMLTRLAVDRTGQASKMLNAFAITQFFGIILAPLNGLILDRHKRRTKPSDCAASDRLADLQSVVLSLALTVSQSILFSICAAIPVLGVQYLTFVLQVINNVFLYGCYLAFTTIAFPACHFGKVCGLGLTLSAVFALLQYPCFALVHGPLQGDPLYLNIGFIVLIALTYIHPINVYVHYKRESRQRGAMRPPFVEVLSLAEEEDRPASHTTV
ncbi:equilibrative nucleobase transporter 1-like [Mustelus asterias]